MASAFGLQMNQEGILDRAYAKIKQKEDQEEQEKTVQFLVQQENLLKAHRQAVLLSDTNTDEATLIMKNMQQGGPMPSDKKEATYEDKIKTIASKQDEYKDEYEGFGSLTEMIKNQDKIAEKSVDKFADAKARMKAALDKPSSKAGNTTAPAGANAVVNSGEVKEAQKVAVEANESDNSTSSEKVNNSNTTSNVSNVSNSSSDGGSQAPSNQSTLSQMIDEVQLEQETQPLPLKAVKGDEFQGFMGKYIRKVEQKDHPQQQQSEVEEESKEPAKKGMSERFEERVAQDAQDAEKADDLVSQYQRAVDKKGQKSLVDRETEKMLREQNEIQTDIEV